MKLVKLELYSVPIFISNIISVCKIKLIFSTPMLLKYWSKP